MFLRMTVVKEALLHGKACLPVALSLVFDISPILCVLFPQDIFLKPFNNIFPWCILLQIYSKEILSIHLNIFHVHTKIVTKKIIKHTKPGSECKREITEQLIGTYTEANRTHSVSLTWSVYHFTYLLRI
jgi:hypothetical protein